MKMDHPAEYTAARTVLLDALEALGPHRDNMVLVGAQAVYLHTGSGELAQPPMTTDADLALDTSALAPSPEIPSTLLDAGFRRGKQPGSWLGEGNVAVDIMVVPHQSGRAKKGARASHNPPHDKCMARITPGLEPALVDNAPHWISGLAADDPRRVEVKVAGAAAPLVAKAIKIDERLADAAGGTSARLKEKDALDLFRLLQAMELDDLLDGFRLHLADNFARTVTQRGSAVLREHGTRADAHLPQLVL
ncbi:hypothetical protein [Amycolatopsis magusensis]|uniref:hypothetical protein n=1 Tax=Amycolatopsis magusensis TaxID=882444 RepID=UPI0037B21DC7